MVSAADQRIHGSDRQTGTASGMPPAAAATAGSSSPPASGQDSSSASSSKKLSQAEQDARILASLGITQRQRKQSLYVLSCVWFASGVEYAVILPTLWSFLQSQGMEKRWFFGLVLAGFSAATMISAPLYGHFADRGSTKKLMYVATLFMMAGNFLYLIANDAYVVLEARFIAGWGAGVASATFAYLSRVTTIKDRTTVIGSIMAARQLGILIGPSLNFGLTHCNFNIGPYNVNNLTSPGFIMMIGWALTTVFVFFYFTDIRPASSYERLGIGRSRAISAGSRSQAINRDENSLRKTALMNHLQASNLSLASSSIISDGGLGESQQMTLRSARPHYGSTDRLNGNGTSVNGNGYHHRLQSSGLSSQAADQQQQTPMPPPRWNKGPLHGGPQPQSHGDEPGRTTATTAAAMPAADYPADSLKRVNVDDQGRFVVSTAMTAAGPVTTSALEVRNSPSVLAATALRGSTPSLASFPGGGGSGGGGGGPAGGQAIPMKAEAFDRPVIDASDSEAKGEEHLPLLTGAPTGKPRSHSAHALGSNNLGRLVQDRLEESEEDYGLYGEDEEDAEDELKVPPFHGVAVAAAPPSAVAAATGSGQRLRSNSSRSGRSDVPMLDNQSLWKEYTQPPLLALFLVSFLCIFNQLGLETWVTPFTQEYFGWYERENSFMYMAVGGLAIGSFIMVRVMASCGVSDRAIMAVGLVSEVIGTVIAMAMLPGAKPKTTYALLAFILSVLFIVGGLPALFIPAPALQSKITRETTQGFGQGLRRTVVSAATIVGPLWAGAMSANSEAFIGLMLGLLAIACVAFAWVYRRLDAAA